MSEHVACPALQLLPQLSLIHIYGTSLRYTQDYQKRLSIIRKVLVQEKEMFEGRKVRDRIVSICLLYTSGLRVHPWNRL